MDHSIFQSQSSPTASSSANQSSIPYLCIPVKKEVPPSAYLPSRRHGISPRSDEDNELVDEYLDHDATEWGGIEHKRRINTLAARMSRKRHQVQKLEEDVARLSTNDDSVRVPHTGPDTAAKRARGAPPR